MNERDREIVEAAKTWLADDTNVWGEESTIVELVAIIDRLDKQLTEMQALLERWVEEGPIAQSKKGFILWRPPSLDVGARLLTETKQLLKEAKEVKDE